MMSSRRVSLQGVLRWLLASTAGLVMGVAGGADLVQAVAGYQAIEMPIAGDSYEDVIRRAEQLAQTAVLNQFNTYPELSQVQIEVLGQRNGQVVPMLSIRVSRQQWQAVPQVSEWTEYHDNSFYALLNPGRRPDRGSTSVAATPARRQVVSAPDPVVQLEEAARDGRISDEEYIELRDSLD